MATVLAITGMHRSGTSVVANYLQQCGVDIGQNLHPGDIGNPRGYYEDLDFLRFHQDLLASFRLPTFVTSDAVLKRQIPEEFRLRAQDIVCKRVRSPVWGWKDCRTSLFLDFWRGIIPDMKVLFLMRHPTSVVDSLLRRGTDPAIARHPAIGFESWRVHNQRILNFYGQNRATCFLVDISELLSNPAEAFTALFSKLRIYLPMEDFDTTYVPSAFKQGRSPSDMYLTLRHPFETWRCLTLYGQMKRSADWPPLRQGQANGAG